MSIPAFLFLLAVVLALIEEFRTRGQSVLGWCVVLIGIGLLWGRIT